MSGALWNEARLETLRQHLVNGLTFLEISRLMKTTRSAIAGKVSRLGAKKPKRERATPSKPRPKVVPMKLPEQEPEPEPLLKPGEWPVIRNACRYIYGDPRDADFRFCGHETIGLSAYCSFHVARMFQPKHPAS